MKKMVGKAILRSAVTVGLLVSLLFVAFSSLAAPSSPTEAQIKQKALPLIRQHASAIFSDQNAIILGNPQGKFSAVMFYDAQCDNCRASEPWFEQLMKKHAELRVVLRPLPILGYYSRQAALAELATNEIDHSKFASFHHILMSAPIPFNSSTLKIAASAADYDFDQLKQAISSNRYQSIIAANLSLAQTILKPAVGYIGTPIFIIGPTPVSVIKANANSAKAKTGLSAKYTKHNDKDIELILGRASMVQLQQAVALAEKKHVKIDEKNDK